MIRLVIADNHQLFQDGLDTILKSIHEFQVVAKVLRCDEILGACRAHNPDCLIVDLGMSDKSVVAVLNSVLKRYKSVKILCTTDNTSLSLLKNVLDSGVHGIISKYNDGKTLVAAIRHICGTRKVYLSADIAEWFAMGF